MGLALCAALLALPLPARADPQELEEGEPVTLEDAWTDPPGQFSMQFSGIYTRLHEGGGKEVLEQGPTFKLGALKNVQVSLNPNYVTGTTGERNTGDVLGDVLFQLRDQTVVLPAIGVDVFYALPFGAGHKSAEYVVRAIASKSLGASEDAPRLHLNLTDYHLTQPDSDARRDQVQLVFGGSFLLTERDALVADIVHGAAVQRGQSETFLELGYSRDLPGDWNCQVGVGKQVAGRGNAVRVFFAVETEVNIF